MTAAVPLDADGLGELVRRGLSQRAALGAGCRAGSSDEIAGTRSFDRKLALARETRRLGLPLTLNVVLHRHNLERTREIIELARELDADRLELANTQYHGWALRNRAALLPGADLLEAARRAVQDEAARGPRPEILFVLPDYFRRRPKACIGGWGQRHLVVTPDGRALPCHGAAELPLEFWNVTERPLSECWLESPGMNAFRGEDWMREPCRSCPDRSKDFGGCRCQAFALTGDAAATDPACELAPDHAIIHTARATAGATGAASFVYRGPERLA